MQIDRSRFLLLTASIAGGACSSSSASSSSGGVVVAAPIIALPAEGDGAPASSSASAPVKSSQTVMGSGDDDALAALDRPPSAADDDGGTCDEGGAPPTGCGTLRAPGPHCESFSDTKAMCGKLARGLRPRVAEQVVDCILAKSGKQSVCDFDLANQCGLVALQKACIEPSTQAACAPIVRACGGRLQMRECQALVSSVTSRNRRNMMTCITEGCSADYCLYQVE